VVAAATRLRPLIRAERAACGRLAASKATAVLCPTLLPRPLPAASATPIRVYTFPVCHALGKKSGCPLYDFAVLYGAPNESPARAAQNSPVRGPWRYAASLHSWTPHRNTLSVLAAIIAHLVTRPDPGP
jgi:hypothetical protein